MIIWTDYMQYRAKLHGFDIEKLLTLLDFVALPNADE